MNHSDPPIHTRPSELLWTTPGCARRHSHLRAAGGWLRSGGIAMIAVALSACPDREPSADETAEETATQREGAPEGYTPPEPTGPARPVLEPFRVARGQAEVGRELFRPAQAVPNRTIRPGDVVPPGRRMHTSDEAVILDGPYDVRVEVDGGATAFLLEEVSLDIALVSGALVAAVPPRGGSTPSPLRVATPVATVVIAGAGEAYVSVVNAGRVWVVAIAGRIRLDRAGSPSAPVTISAGEAAVLTAGSEPTVGPGPSDVEAARRGGPPAPTGPDAVSLQARLVNAVRQLDETVAVSTGLSEDGARLSKALGSQSRGDRSADIRREAVALAQRRLALRERLMIRWEHALILAAREDAEATLLGEQRARVRAWFAP